MKKLALLALLSFTSFVSADEVPKIYVPMKNLSFTEEGIFIKSNCSLVQLEDISYDYEAKSYFIYEEKSRQRTIKTCNYCNEFSWWVEGRCCFNEECIRSCF